MMRPALRATLCLAALAAACPCILAQTSPATAAIPSPDTAAHSPDVTLSATYAETPSLASQIATILAAPNVARDHWGIQVTTLDGTPIYSLNEAQLFQPASNAKLFTTAAALALLGPTKTFQTVVAVYGRIEHGTLHGNLYLVGGGDANFGAQDVPYIAPSNRAKAEPKTTSSIADIDDLAQQIVAAGIMRIDGDVVGDDSRDRWNLYPENWDWDDLVWGYGAPVTALSIHDNSVEISASPKPAIFSPPVPYYTVSGGIADIMGQSSRNCDSIRFSTQEGSKDLHIEGALPENAAPCVETLAIRDPAEYAALALSQALESRGVRITGRSTAFHNISGTERSAISVDALPPDSGMHTSCVDTVSDAPNANVIARHYSPALAADVIATNKLSQNLHAEVMLRNMARVECGATDGYPKDVREFLTSAGLDANDFVFYDGSGLSTHDLVTPRATAKLLAYAAHDPKTGAPQPWFALWKSSLPVGGEDGTLASRFGKAPLKDHLFAKTGTLGEARALSGYLDAASGRTVIFSIFVGNHLPGTSDDRDAMDKIVAAIQATQ
jgi:D-alanyl-D-alanine carboxypeptidase/D-alanyl-D-alanine-endopeptidase (penicillin-binding protein 4)